MKKIEEKKTWIGFEIIYEMFDLKFNVRNMKVCWIFKSEAEHEFKSGQKNTTLQS